MERLKFYISFHFSHKKQTYLIVTASYKKKSINLSHATFLLFLYNNEKDIDKLDIDFSYKLAKYLKKVRVGKDLHYAIAEEADIAWFFLNVKEYDVLLEWRVNKTRRPVIFSSQVPIRVRVKQEQNSITCTMPNRDQWADNPYSWLCFKTKKDTLYFCQGKIILNPTKSLVKFINMFNDRNKLAFSAQDAMYFVQQIYTPNKRVLQWHLRAKLTSFLPNEDPPIPVLSVHYEANMLTPVLTYKYGNEIINPDAKEHNIKDKTTNKLHKRSFKMESIYQQDLMELFMEFELPFLLQNPGHIAAFLDKVVPILKERDWEVYSDTSDFVLHDQPLDLDFGLASSGQNWFSFQSHADIDGKSVPLRELARLMVENQGYIQTNSGYVKLDESTQKDLETLSKFGAFQEDKKFKKSELMPLLSATTNIIGKGVETKSFIERFKKLEQFNKLEPGTNFQGELRDYQEFGMSWINFLYANQFGGVLADDMGLGKTVQTIAFSSQIEESGPILVIGPTNVIYNWEKEITKFTKKSKVVIYSGPNRHDLLEDLVFNDFIITSFGVLKNDIELLSAIPFKAIFVDEAQNIKNPNTKVSVAIKKLNAQFRLAMTGTPIENHIQDLWNIFDFVMPNYLGSYKDFDRMMKDGQRDIIRSKIKPFVLRREKGEVLDSLPEKTEVTIKCPMTKDQERLYETVLHAAKKGIQNMSGKNERLNVLTALLKLRQVCIHPGLLKEMPTATAIESGKFLIATEKITDIIDQGSKIVLFSQFTEMLNIMQRWCEEKKIYTERIDGTVSAKDRMKFVDRFQESDDPGLFLISLKAGGVGLNLTAADYVIHLDPWWNPAIESQATDRVHRMGQKNKVIVYKLITEDTIEEKIQTLQDNKRQLLSEIIDIDSAADKSLNFDEIKNLLQ